MLKQFKTSYKHFGIRATNQLAHPPAFQLTDFHWSRNAILHHVAGNTGEALPSKQALFDNDTDGFAIKHVIAYSDIGAEGAIKTQFLPKKSVKAFHLKNPTIKLVLNNKAGLTKADVPLIVNYGLLANVYDYRKTPMASYLEWRNTYRTVAAEINGLSVESNRDHFLVMEVPTALPTYNRMIRWVDKKDGAFYQAFNTVEKLMVFDLFAYIYSGRTVGEFFNAIPQEYHDRINLIVKYREKLTLLNLGFLEYVGAKDTDDEGGGELGLAQFDIQGVRQYGAEIAAKLFLGLMVSLPMAAVMDVTALEVSETKDNKDEAVVPEDDSQTEDDLADVDALLTTTQQDDLEGDEAIQDLADVPVEDKVQGSLDKAFQEGVDTKPQGVDDYFVAFIDHAVEFNGLSGNDVRKLEKEYEASQRLRSPYAPDKTLREFTTLNIADLAIKQEDSMLPDSPVVFDKSMLRSRLKSIDERYIGEFLQAHIMRSSQAFLKRGVIIKDYRIDRFSNLVGEYEDHTITLKPVAGDSSTIRMRLPVFRKNGEFLSNGVNYRLRKQDTDLPIRKIAPDIVGLSTDYGKLFVSRSQLAAHSMTTWYYNQIIKASGDLDANGYPLLTVNPAPIFNPDFKSGRVFGSLARNMTSIENAVVLVNLDAGAREHGGKLYSAKERVPSLETDKITVCGIWKPTNETLLMHDDGTLLVYRQSKHVEVGELPKVLGLSKTQPPLESADLEVMGNRIPVAVVLGFYYGLPKLFALLGSKPRVISARKRVTVADNEVAIKFNDVTLVFAKSLGKDGLIINGLVNLQKHLKSMPFSAFESKVGFVNLLSAMNIPARYLTAFNDLDALFIDPISEDKLTLMGEPTAFKPLLLRACELLETDDHPHQVDTSVMVKRGYDRIPGIVYRAFTQSLRTYGLKRNTGKQKIELDPWEVWRTITQDNALKIPEEINPIQNLKEKEAVTMLGVGGRSRESLAEGSRIYHKNARGIISEATVDSGDVGINTSTSADPGFINLLGMTEKLPDDEINPTAQLSTSALLAPESLTDDQ